MGVRYPPMSPALPSYMRPTRTARILQPGVVLVTLVLLLLCGITGIGIGIARFKEERVEPLPASIGACQGFMIVASGFSLMYVILHICASVQNEPIGDVRPPDNRLHAICFIVARVCLVLWMICIITTSIVIARPGICLVKTLECKLQITDVVAANLSFLATGALLTALEACRYPFEIPEAFSTGINCRVSSFGDDLLERSASVSSASDNRERDQAESFEAPERENERPGSPERPVPGEFPSERRLTPLLPMIPVTTASAWSDEVEHSMREDIGEKKTHGKADSAISLGSETCSSSSCSGSEALSTSSARKKSTSRPRIVTPSSSISNESRRSPLSRMRSAEFPDIVIQQELKFLPAAIPPPERWTTTRPIPISRLSIGSGVYNKPQRPPLIIPPKSLARKLGPYQGPIIRKPAPNSLIRRRTIDIKVPGAFIEYRPSLDDERKLEEHARKIEAQIEARSQNEEEGKPNEQQIKDNPLNSRARYRERPAIQRSLSTADTQRRNRLSKQILNPDTKIKELKRLSLVDISPELGRIFEDPK